MAVFHAIDIPAVVRENWVPAGWAKARTRAGYAIFDGDRAAPTTSPSSYSGHRSCFPS
jgi:hypothetical protein